MNLYDTIRTRLGITNPNNMLDERVYSPGEVEEDLIALDFELDELKTEINQLSDRYNQKLREVVRAAEWEEESLLMEADGMEADREDKIATYQELHDLKRMIKSIKSTRERVSRQSLGLNAQETIQRADQAEVATVLQKELRKKGLNEKKVRKISGMLTKGRKRAAEQSGPNNRDLDKHRDRVETLKETPEDEQGDWLGDRDSDRDPDRDRDDRRVSASVRADVRRD